MEAASVFLPLFGAIGAGLFGRFLGDRGSQLVSCGSLILAAVFSLFVFADVVIGGNSREVVLVPWIESGNFKVDWALHFDALSAVMVSMVTIVSASIHVYSIGYMEHDDSIPRF